MHRKIYVNFGFLHIDKVDEQLEAATRFVFVRHRLELAGPPSAPEFAATRRYREYHAFRHHLPGGFAYRAPLGGRDDFYNHVGLYHCRYHRSSTKQNINIEYNFFST